jgi:uncharacterized protein
LRIVTNARVFERPEQISEAWKQGRAWLDCDSVWIPQPTDRHADILGGILVNAGADANLVPDAHLAAPALSTALRCIQQTEISRVFRS